MQWSTFWERHRIRISQAGGLLLICVARPRSNALYAAGFALVLVGEALRLWAAGHIRKGEALAQDGPYSIVRHPLYVGSFFLACGFALMCTSLRHWLSTAFIWAVILATFRWLYGEKIAMEEADLRSRFGGDFDTYRLRVPQIWPAWDLLPQALQGGSFSMDQALRNKEHKTMLAILGLAVLLRFKMIYGL